MGRNVRILDYDDIDEWSPWFDEIMGAIGPADLIEQLRRATPEYVEDARGHVVSMIGRQALVTHLHEALAPYQVRVFHGTRVTVAELNSIKQNGLRALVLSERRAALVAVFSEHPDWPQKESMLDDQLNRHGPGWEKAHTGKREDGSVHVCLSRAGLLHGCNHYLMHGAEVDQNIAMMLFDDNSGLKLLTRARKPYIVSFSAPYSDAANAANPYGFHKEDLPSVIDSFLSAWAYKKSHPTFEVVKLRDAVAARFPAPILADRIERIEPVDDALLPGPRPRA
jgi:hypothetical protein